ncbi:OmpA family protein [Acidomonas methanolica]|uniref:OmpA family protein n=1 Tax=Acidomonas methanolica TaxID=437 RepID=UPI00211A94DE|nr:OmpA family protein [Acidomonas methanolica]MCQ9156442.1 OmpA family protein [Acidomonas methanolica]
MKRLLPALLLAAPSAFTAGAYAQVSTNIDALPAAPASPPAAQAAAPSRRAPASSAATSHAAASHTASRKTATASATTPPDVSPRPPAPVVIPPPAVAVQTYPPVPATPVKPVADAPGSAETEPDGMRLTFGSGSANLNPASLDALTALAKTLAAEPTRRISLLAYAAGSDDDRSTSRRVALARALTVRAVLVNEGVATTRIYPRAIGLPPHGDASTPDRLDLIASGTVPAGPEQAQFGAVPPSSPAKATP